MVDRGASTRQLEMTVVEHLAELRMRLLVVLASFVVGVVAGWYGQAWLIQLFAHDVGRLVFFTPAEMFVTKLRIAATLSMFITLPVFLAQAWLFVLPALYPHEHKVFRRYVPVAYGLFVCGLAFGYFLVYPVVLRFLLGMTETVQPAVSIADHFSMFVGTILPFGLLFEVPLAMLLLAHLRLIDPLVLQRRRRHVIFWSFVLSAVITPPDVISQVLLALPMVILFELGIFLARREIRRDTVLWK